MAVERLIEIIGEAARNVSPALKTGHPEIPWRDIIGQRNILAHDYADIDDELVFLVATQYIPELVAALRNIIPPPV